MAAALLSAKFGMARDARSTGAVDTEQSDGIASGSRVCGGELIWAWRLAKPCGRSTHGYRDCLGRTGRVHRPKETASNADRRADRHFGDRMIENVYFTYFAVVGMVSLWLPVLFFARGAATDFLRGLAMKAGHSG